MIPRQRNTIFLESILLCWQENRYGPFITDHSIKYFSSAQYFLIHMTDIYMILFYQSPFHILNSHHNTDTSLFSVIMDQSCLMNPIAYEWYYRLVSNIRLFWTFEKPLPNMLKILVLFNFIMILLTYLNSTLLSRFQFRVYFFD